MIHLRHANGKSSRCLGHPWPCHRERRHHHLAGGHHPSLFCLPRLHHLLQGLHHLLNHLLHPLFHPLLQGLRADRVVRGIPRARLPPHHPIHCWIQQREVFPSDANLPKDAPHKPSIYQIDSILILNIQLLSFFL